MPMQEHRRFEYVGHTHSQPNTRKMWVVSIKIRLLYLRECLQMFPT